MAQASMPAGRVYFVEGVQEGFVELEGTPELHPGPQASWATSAVFGKPFRLTEQTDPLGHPEYTLAVQ